MLITLRKKYRVPKGSKHNKHTGAGNSGIARHSKIPKASRLPQALYTLRLRNGKTRIERITQ